MSFVNRDRLDKFVTITVISVQSNLHAVEKKQQQRHSKKPPIRDLIAAR